MDKLTCTGQGDLLVHEIQVPCPPLGPVLQPVEVRTLRSAQLPCGVWNTEHSNPTFTG